MQLPRREFIGLLAGAAAGAAAGIPAGRALNGALATADQPLYPPRGVEDLVLSVCNACPGGCGVRARRIGGRVVKLEGNPLHPISGGRLCAKGQAAVHALYHPDRVRQPMRRTGRRGSIRSFEPASWELALSEIGTRMQALRDEARPHSIVLLHDDRGGIGNRLARRLLEAIGSPNAIAADRGNDTVALALEMTQGLHAVPAYDIRGADYVLSIGCELLEASPSPVFTSRGYGDFRQTRAAHRGKFVHADPRLSITAASADEWIPIRPRTHGIFALGLAAAIVAEDLYDREFIAEWCEGFEELRTLLHESFTLESVAERTGVTVNTILRIAREVAAAATPVILGPRKGPLLPGRWFDHLGAHVLNALAGNIDQPGGVLVPDVAPLAAWPPIEKSATAREPRLDGAGAGAACDAEQLASALLSGKPYRAEMLLALGADPLFTTAGDRFRAALDRVPFIVTFASIPNDTAVHSDWILPQPHFLEESDVVPSPSGVPFASVSLSQPAVTAGVRSVASVVLDLAKRLHLERAFPWPDLDAIVRAEIDGLYSARRGAIMGTAFDEAWVRMMEHAGWWAPGYASAEELWTRSLEAGGWWDPFYDHGDWSRVLRTPSGRFEFCAGALRKYIEASNGETAAPNALDLLLFEPLAIAGGSGAELPFLQALLDPGHEAHWDTWGELHPDTAREHGIRDGMRIRVSSPQGSIDVTAKITDRVVAGAIAIPAGLGKENGGRWASGIGANPLRLVGDAREPVSARLDFEATRVLIDRGARRS